MSRLSGFTLSVLLLAACSPDKAIRNNVDHAPVARIQGPDSVTEGRPVTFSASGSRDQDGDSLTYLWTFEPSTDSATSQHGVTITHTFAAPGSYEVHLRVTDPSTLFDTATIRVRVAQVVNHPPVASLIGPSTGHEGANLQFDASASRDPDGDSLHYVFISGEGRTYSDNYGTSRVGWAYGNNGTYVTSVIVSDTHGAADTASISVAITNVPPVVSAVQPPREQAVGDKASAIVTSSDSGWLDARYVTIRWGDGMSDSFPSIPPVYVGGPSRDSTTHTYAKPGDYWVSAIVRDNDGAKDSATAQYAVTVFDATERKTVAGYETLDLGTLGGAWARPADVNDRGQIVGESRTAEGTTHAFLWDAGVMHDLGSLGRINSHAARINDAGLIAGWAWSGSGEDHLSTAAVIWRNGTGTLFDAGQPAGPGVVDAMNESGDILWSWLGHESGTNWLWHNGAWRALGNWFSLKDADDAILNDHGQIVIRDGFRARLLEGDSLHDIGVLSWRCAGDSLCGWSFPMDINEHGDIVGTSSDTGKITRFVLWKDGKIQALALVPHAPAWDAHAYINDRGQIAVSSGGQAFFWSDGKKQTLVAPGGPLEVTGLNENGEVVGNFLTGTSEQHVFVWSNARGMVDLGTGPHAFSAAWAVGINSEGDIIGYTAICQPDYYGRCGYLGFPSQARAVVWRKQ